MVKEQKTQFTTLAIVAAVAVVFSCVTGIVGGGLAGYLVGRQQARSADKTPQEQTIPAPSFPEELPESWQEWPHIIPDLDRAIPGRLDGALIREVVTGTPADRAGLHRGDIIVGIDSTPVDGNHPLPDVLGQYKPGDRITIRYWRAGREESVRTELGEHPDNAGQPYLGVYFGMIEWRGFGTPSD
jgi:membrane-associated protease RseP (regulator of RpoE activity)